MTEKFLALIFTTGVAFLLLLVFRIRRGITMKYGIAGLVLILMPHFFAIFQNPGDRMFNIAMLIGAVIGILLLMLDMPRKTQRNSGFDNPPSGHKE
jgi:hypothetical protein